MKTRLGAPLAGVLAVAAAAGGLHYEKPAFFRSRAMSEEQSDMRTVPPKESTVEQKGGPGGDERLPFYTPYSVVKETPVAKEHSNDVEEDGSLTDEESQANRAHGEAVAGMWKALRRDDVATMRRLFEEGFDVNESDDEDATALHHAAYQGQIEMARLLLDYGADVNAKNLYGYTPLMHAAQSGHTDMVILLLEKGADVNVEVPMQTSDVSQPGLTAITLAISNQHTSIAELLKGAGARH